MVTRASWTIGLEVEQLAAAESEIATFLSDQGVDGRGAYVSQLVVEEIVRNLIQHTPPNARHRDVTVALFVSPLAVTVTIEDHMPPFPPDHGPKLDVDAPLEERRAGGMGLHLVRTLADELRYEQIQDRNRLTAVVARS